MKVEVRFSEPSELARVPSKFTRRGLSLLIDDELRAIAIIHFDPAMAYATIDAFGPVPRVTMHRFGRICLETATALTGGRFLACADRSIARSGAWLERLGFELKGEVAEGPVYMARGKHERPAAGRG